MAQKELVFKLKFVDENGAIVEKTAASIKDINKSITDLKNELENTELGSEAWNDLANDLGKAENALGKVGDAQKKAKESTMSFSDSLSAIPGPIGGVIQGAKALNASLMKLVANPIGAVIAAIVLALTALYKAFASTKAGAEKLDQIFAGISAAMDVLRDRVLKVGSALVKFFSGDFTGALEDVKGAVSGIGDEIATEFQQAMALKAELQSITDATRELNKERARQNKEIATAKLVINDETKSYAERQAALEQVRQAEIALAKQEEILALRRYEAIKAQNALSDSSKEALDEEANAYIALQAAQQASLQKQKELFDQQKALRDRQRAEQKAAADKRKQELQQLADLEQQLMLELLDSETDKAIEQVRIQEKAQREQLKALNASAEQGQQILLKVVQNTQMKITAIEEAAEEKRIEAFRASRQRLIDISLANEQKVLERLTTLNEKYLSDVYDEYEKASKELRVVDEERVQMSLEMQEQTYDMLLEANKEFVDDSVDAAQKQYDIQIRNNEKARNAELKVIEDSYIAQKEKAEGNAIALSQIEYNYQIQKEQANQRYNELQIEEQTNLSNTIIDINQKAADREVQITENKNKTLDYLRAQQAAADKESVALAAAGLDSLAELAGKETDLGKALAIASTTFSTYQAAQAAYASQFLIPTPDAPVRAAVAAGIAVAQGLARVAQIVKTDTNIKAADGMVVGNGSGRADNVPVMVSNGETIINAKSSRMFRGLLSSINQAGGGRRFASNGISSMTTQTSPEQNLLNQIAGSSSAPIKTYVVSTDVSSMQSLDRQIKSRSVL